MASGPLIVIIKLPRLSLGAPAVTVFTYDMLYVVAAAAGPTMGTSNVASRARVARMAMSFLDFSIQF
ncbi:hypothetical protein [Desulfofundulus sp.]|uniref:hypothetical protein n=1 Tax=Desulfofundulus sp. TaxID=2282750 RepID=UPI003C767E4E